MIFPFTAICGQDDIKTALLLCAINPKIGGVLLRGEKGTAKSTLVRGLAQILPDIPRRKGCVYSVTQLDDSFCNGCDICILPTALEETPTKVITLPLNATEDRIVGGLDIKATISSGVPRFQPGLLAQAHGHILYVDEVNLLDDHLVDAILSATATGINRIEREGLSVWHPSQFTLIGTMNPEEGALRPQFLDRFGLCLDVTGLDDIAERVELMEKREAFDADPYLFSLSYAAKTVSLQETIAHARNSVETLFFPPELRHVIADVCVAANVAGHRADVVMEQAARAHAALMERSEVTLEDIRIVAPWVLNHRKREGMPPEQEQETSHPPPSSPKENEETSEAKPTDSSSDESQAETSLEPSSNASAAAPKSAEEDVSQDVFDMGEPFRVKPFQTPKDRMIRRGSGRRSRSRISGRQGRYVKSAFPKGAITDIAMDATLRAAAPYQKSRPEGALFVKLKKTDLRQKIRERKIGNFLLFVVDASGSMGAKGRMVATKGAILSLLLDAYQKRDKVGMITFHQSEAKLVLPPTSSIDLAAKLLAELPVGGKTPLSAAVLRTAQIIKAQFVREPMTRPIVIFITDGKSNVPMDPQHSPMAEALSLSEKLALEERAQFIVVDTEMDGLIQFGRAQKIATALQATYFKMNDLKTQSLLDVVKGVTQ